MMIDLDGFKQINDQYGHKVGDLALQRVADLLKGHLRTSDFACRYGGDEFAVLLPDTSRNEAEKLKERLNKGLSESNKGAAIQISLSVGIKESDGSSFSDLMHDADSEMYREKNLKNEAPISDVAENLQEAVAQEDLPPEDGIDPVD